jgi:hypothetical protein
VEPAANLTCHLVLVIRSSQVTESSTKNLKQQPRLQLAGVVLLGPVVRVAATLLPPAPVLWVLRQLARFFPT